MNFTSAIFIGFLALFFVFWPLTRKNNTVRLAYLVLASFIFYGWVDWRLIFFLIAVNLVSYWGSKQLGKDSPHRRAFLIFSVLFNAGLLVFFRYKGILFANTAGKFDIASLGVSFYTVQAVSYLFDVYQGRIAPANNLLVFFAYQSMFPKLTAGPIERAGKLLPQLEAVRATTEQDRWEGTKLVAIGYFKKAVIADNLAYFVRNAFDNPASEYTQTVFWWLMVTAFAFQLYYDFSGYSNIARGLARWMGYELSVNFDHPYISTSLSEFWTRWHISFSNWLRDYIFMPLSRSRWGRKTRHLNMWITLLFSGWWHGAGWTYIIWGALHALYTSIERWTGWHLRLKNQSWGRWPAVILVNLQVWVAWVFFRANTIDQAGKILKVMFVPSNQIASDVNPVLLSLLLVAALPEFLRFLNVNFTNLLPAKWQPALEISIVVLFLIASVYLRGPVAEFVYFQF